MRMAHALSQLLSLYLFYMLFCLSIRDIIITILIVVVNIIIMIISPPRISRFSSSQSRKRHGHV